MQFIKIETGDTDYLINLSQINFCEYVREDQILIIYFLEEHCLKIRGEAGIELYKILEAI